MSQRPEPSFELCRQGLVAIERRVEQAAIETFVAEPAPSFGPEHELGVSPGGWRADSVCDVADPTIRPPQNPIDRGYPDRLHYD